MQLCRTGAQVSLSFGILRHVGIVPCLLWLPIMSAWFLLTVLPPNDFVVSCLLQISHLSNKTSTFLAVSPLKILNMGCFTCNCRINTERGYSVWWVLYGPKKLLVSVFHRCDFISPTHLNWLPMASCLGVATSHVMVTLQPNHISIDHSVVHILLTLTSSGKTSSVALSSSFCKTTV